MSLTQRLRNAHHSLTTLSKDDAKDLLVLLFGHKFFFGLGFTTAFLFKLFALFSKEGWSLQSVIVSTPDPTEAMFMAGGVTFAAGIVALPWVLVWKYSIYPRTKQYRGAAVATNLLTIAVGLVVTFLAFKLVTMGYTPTAEELKATGESLQDEKGAGLGAALGAYVVFLLPGAVLSTAWERYLDGTLNLGTPSRQVGATLIVIALLVAPAGVAAVSPSLVGAAPGSDSVADKVAHTDGYYGPDIDINSKHVSVTTEAGVVVSKANAGTLPPANTTAYSPASTSYNASIVTVQHIRVEHNGTAFTSPSRFAFTLDPADGQVINRGAFNTKSSDSTHLAIGYGYETNPGILTLEQVDHTWYYVDVVQDGEVHRYVVKLDNPNVDGSDENSR